MFLIGIPVILFLFSWQNEGTYLNICRHYRAIYETPMIRDNPEEKTKILKHVALYVVLSPHNNEQSGSFFDLTVNLLNENYYSSLEIWFP